MGTGKISKFQIFELLHGELGGYTKCTCIILAWVSIPKYGRRGRGVGRPRYLGIGVTEVTPEGISTESCTAELPG